MSIGYTHEEMAKKVAELLYDCHAVNLGIGLPTLVANYLVASKTMIHSENGLLGMGPYPKPDKVDAQIVNAGKETVTIATGGSTFDSTLSFGMIRGGHIDVAVMGAMQVSVNGDLANWSVPGKKITGMGGAMDLAVGAKKVFIMMNHHEKSGTAKLLRECTLPLTASKCVDLVITNLGVFKPDTTVQKFVIKDIYDGANIKMLGDDGLFVFGSSH